MSDKIIYRRDKGKQLTSAEVDGNFKYLDSKIDKVSLKDYFIKDGGYDIVDSQIYINRGSKWVFEGIEHSNGVDFIFEINPAQTGCYRVDIVFVDSSGYFDLKKGEESTEGYKMPIIGNSLPYLYLYLNDKGIQNASNNASGDYVPKLSYRWVQLDLQQSELPINGLNSNIDIVGGNLIIENIANGIKSIRVDDDFPDGYEVSIRNSRSSYLTIVNSGSLRVYTGKDYTVRPGEIIVFKYDKYNNNFSVSGGLNIGIDMDNIDEILGVDVMRVYIDSSSGDALNPNDLNTTLTPNVMRYFKSYNNQAVGWQWRRYTGNSQAEQDADAEWSVGKTNRVLELTAEDFTDAINKGNVSYMVECIVNSQIITGVWVGKLVDQAKTIRIESTGTQFKGVKPEYIMLKAVVNNFQPSKIEWLKDGNLVNISNSFLVYQNQVDSFAVYTLRVADSKGSIYTDAITISKVVDGKDGADGKSGAVPVWTEWMTGDVHYNNGEQIFYIYHRPTESVWKLKPGYTNVVAPANPDDRYVRQPHLEQVVTRVLVAEGANLAGFIFKDGKLISQYPNLQNPNISIDGNTGKAIFKDAEFTGKVTILPGSPALDTIDKAVKDGIDNLDIGGRNYALNSESLNIGTSRYRYYNLSEDITGPVVFGFEDIIMSKGNIPSYMLVHLMHDSNMDVIVHSSNIQNPPKFTKYNISKKVNVIRIYMGKDYADSAGNEGEIKRFKVEKGLVKSDWNPAPEDIESQIADQEIYIEYSIDGKSGWHTSMLSTDVYMRQKKGPNGAWGQAVRIAGKDGDKGATGLQGPKGDKGNTGDKGATGSQGPKGDKGNTGDKGATGSQGPQGVPGVNGEPLGDGVDLFPDNDFRFGNNGAGGYAGANASTLVRIAKSADAPTLSGFMRRVINNGTIVDSSNRRGGFVQNVTSRASAVFIHKIIAKIPVGHAIRDYNNQTGNGRVVTWLTSQQGTGKFELYMYKHRCGVGGTFSTFGHVAFIGPAGTASSPIYYDIASATVYDMSIPDRRFDFLSTTIDGNSIATGTLRVGQGNIDTAGLTGVRDSGESSNVAFWAGVSFGNRKTAPFRVDTNGNLFATRANISGAINAMSGFFGGFKITLNSFESVNGAYRVESATGMQILRDKNGKVRNMRGLNENGEPVDTWYDEDGNETMTWSSKGVMYPGFIKESYTKYSYYKISALTVAGVTPFFNALRKKQGGAWTDGQPQGPYSEFQYTTDGIAPGTQTGYTYNAGNNPESENNKKYEGFYYTSENKLGSKIADGWYVSHKVFTRTYGQLRDFNSPNPSMPNMIVTSPFYDETFNIVRFSGGKIVESRSCKGRLDMNYPSASSVEVAVPYSAVSVI